MTGTTDKQSDQIEVRVGHHVVRGQRQRGVNSFRGLPYAERPVGANRFAPAVPLDLDRHGSDQVIDGLAAGASVPQPPSRVEHLMGRPTATYDEASSLTLNVWAPAGAEKRPVLFWLHGGALVSGSASWQWYDGARLAATEDIVVVTANYRLGALGYLDLRDIEPAGATCVNAGLSDQMVALEWVAANIVAFGGDPDAITVGGQSAGAEAAALIAGSDRTGGLVRRLLLQSGGSHGWVQPREHSQSVTAGYLAVLRTLVGGPLGLEALQALPVDVLLNAQVKYMHERLQSGDANPPFGVADGTDVPTGGTRAFLATRTDLDLLAGWTRDELQGFTQLNPDASTMLEDVAAQALTPRFGPQAQSVLDRYRALRPGTSPADLLAAINGDSVLMAPLLDWADERADAGAPTYLYRFDWSGSKYGACHCVDLPFFFGNVDAWNGAEMLGSNSPSTLLPVAHQLMGAVGSFVRTGMARVPGAEWASVSESAGAARLGCDPASFEPGLGSLERDILAVSSGS